jgi:kinesin family protein 5
MPPRPAGVGKAKKDPDEGRVVVGVRIRPALGGGDEGGADRAVFCEAAKHLRVETRQGESKSFNFDHVLDFESTQAEVYERIGKPAVDQVLRGYNGCIMAYGQTGSGKTFTLGNNLGEKQTGIIPRAISQIFAAVAADKAHVYTVQMSYIQIYCEMIQDLLAPGNDRMQLREDQTDGVFIVGVTSMPLESPEDCLALLEEGNRNRVTAFTNMNAHSSRSHACLIVKVERRSRPVRGNELIDAASPGSAPAAVASSSRVLRGKLTLVDLAGSERIKKTGASGQRLNEAKLINLSLTCLGNVIHALSTKSPHVPYRDSKLTRLLQDSLGGNAKTSLIVTVAPGRRDIGESVCSLLFGQRAMKVHNFPVINEEIDYKALCAKLQAQLDQGGDGAAWAEVEVHRLRGEVERLEAELAAANAKIEALQSGGSGGGGGSGVGVGGGGGATSSVGGGSSAASTVSSRDAHEEDPAALKKLKKAHYAELSALASDFEEQIAMHAEAADEWAAERTELAAKIAKQKADLVVALNETMERDALLEELEACLAQRDAEIIEKDATIVAANTALSATRAERDR